MLRIKELRHERALTQQQLADRVGTTHATIQRLESGNRGVDEKWVRRIARAFNVHPGELFEPISQDVYTDHEYEVLTLWRKMPEDARESYLQLARNLAREHEPAR
jgi:transcriptional regulator with XRE-family HTH domain